KKHTTLETKVYDIMPRILFDNSGRYITYYSFVEELIVYKNEKADTLNVTSSDYRLNLLVLPKNYDQMDAFEALNGKISHRIYYSSKYDHFIRRLKLFTVKDKKQEVDYRYEILDSDFNVSKTFVIENYGGFSCVNGNIYLKEMDRASQKATFYEFKIG